MTEKKIPLPTIAALARATGNGDGISVFSYGYSITKAVLRQVGGDSSLD